jgi:tetratricopeptide (TPR) repeat protein
MTARGVFVRLGCFFFAAGISVSGQYRASAHVAPADAQKEYDRAKVALAKTHLDEAVLHLERAIEIDPDYVEARNDLGATFARQGKTDSAIAQFEKAAALDSRYSPAFYNLGLMYLGQERIEDAVRAARTAIDIDPSHLQARLVLGMALVFGDQFTDEAVENLRRCADEYPQARLFLARALAGRGEKAPARAEIQSFLASGEPTGRGLAQSWLQALQ